MDPNYLITADMNGSPIGVRTIKDKGLNVMECFTDTIQGEGVSIGVPATFLRLQGCTLDCVWCDTEWRKGGFYTYQEILRLFESYNVLTKLKYDSHHLIITGGSPLKQQDSVVEFLKALENMYMHHPYVEIENECVLKPIVALRVKVSQWNNSPKLENSGMKLAARYKPEVIKLMAGLENSWFKFVIKDKVDWKEVEELYLEKELIKRNQIVLMPLGATKEEVEDNRRFVFELAIKKGVRYTSREQLMVNTP